jgi:hypothetical protein
MRQINFFCTIIVFFTLGFETIKAQPSPKIYRINLEIVFRDKQNDTLIFKTKDSINFYSCKGYHLSFMHGSIDKNKRKIEKEFLLGNDKYYDESLVLKNNKFLFSLVRTNFKKHFDKIMIKHKSKVMEIFLDNFHDNFFKETTLNILFKEGIFELTDGENPKLVAINKKKNTE